MNSAENRRMAAALFYLQATTLVGATKTRLKRLRQPKYLVGALLFVFYFAAVIARPAWQAQHQPLALQLFSPQGLELIVGFSALFLFAWAALAWLFPASRASLRFSEAEIAFLFPAPLSRLGLINFSLLRAQAGVFLSAFLISLVFNRGRGLPGNPLQHAVALWLVIATMKLHSLAASFTVGRFLEAGERRWLRRAMVSALVLLLVVGLLAWLALKAPPLPALHSDAGLKPLVPWLVGLVRAPPLGIVLAPFGWLARPIVSGASGWWLSLLPAIALLLLHYLWVVRVNIAFEEASIDAAARRARVKENMRTGKWPWSSGRRKASNEPFALPGKGAPVLAFLWSGLIGSGGGLWRPRVVGAIVVAGLLAVFALAASPWGWVLPTVGAIAGLSCMMSVLFGAMVMQGRLRDLLEVLDIYKASPLRGRQIALGQLLTPVAQAAMAQWFSLLVLVACVHAAGKVDLGDISYTGAGAFGVALLGPLLCALLMCIPFAWILWFPAWAASLGNRGGGFEAAGQRLIFGFVYMVAAAAMLLPAVLFGALVGWLGSLMGTPASLSMVLMSLVAAAVLLVELGAIIYVLGARIDRFDVSTELR